MAHKWQAGMVLVVLASLAAPAWGQSGPQASGDGRAASLGAPLEASQNPVPQPILASPAALGRDLSLSPPPLEELLGQGGRRPFGFELPFGGPRSLEGGPSNTADLVRQLEDLTRKYDVLNNQLNRVAQQEEAARKEREAEKRRATGVFAPRTETRKEPMYQIGLFWWRDDTKEIAGRGAYAPDMEPAEHRISEGVVFGDGVSWTSEDKYFKLVFHNLTQLDMRQPFPTGDPLHGGFVIPRQRWYFNGSVGDYADFVTSINRGYGSLDVLDAYVDYHVNREWLNFRVGRFKMPSQYEYIEMAEGDLIGPERSLYVANLAANRQLGAMAWGYLFDERIKYYLAVSDGPRRSFEDYNSSRDFFAYLDYRPFITEKDSFLRNLHLVSTVNGGTERNPVTPYAFQTMNQMTDSADASFFSPTFMEFKNGVFENGPQMHYGFEPVYYYKSFGFLGSLQGGYQDYSVGNLSSPPVYSSAGGNRFIGVNSPFRTHVPEYGWSVAAWYFLTGEEITRRRFLVEPRRPFGYYNGTLNPGAFELFGRFANMQLGSQVFTGGLVDPTMWTNRASTTDIGVNWYLNHFIKFTIDWQHAFLGGPVVLNPAGNQHTSHYDMLLFRAQLFF